ncbi:MAG: hypothetical protein LBC07_01510 [Elusimicrobiota bacterium]|jgi:hypothetical protein|nr:hypothetical protein [Elusimicrobiota bacterium]
MFIDINELCNAKTGDTNYRSDQLCKAQNLLEVQERSLYYAQNFGVDLAYFIESSIHFQNEVMQAHISEKLMTNYLVVAQYSAAVESFFQKHSIQISNAEVVNNAL